MAAPLAAHHLPFFIAYGVYAAEVLAPILLIVGFLTRPAAAAIVFELSMALFLVVGPKTFTLAPRWRSFSLAAAAMPSPKGGVRGTSSRQLTTRNSGVRAREALTAGMLPPFKAASKKLWTQYAVNSS